MSKAKSEPKFTTYYSGYYLVGIDSKGDIQTSDGHHDSPSEVQEALELYKRLNLYKPDLTYKMAKLESDFKAEVTWKLGQNRGQSLWIARAEGLLKLSEVPTHHEVKINEEAAKFVGTMVKAYKER